MTQLMLFDAPASSLPGVSSPVVSAASQAEVQPAPEEQDRPAAEPIEGVQRMGDLARFVLLRYQLVAQRRAAQAARGAATQG